MRTKIVQILAWAAITAQVLLLYRFFVMGLGWGGFWYLANMGQAVAILVLAIAFLRKRPLLVLVLPVVSLVLSKAFLAVDPSLKTTECTAAELSAASELPPPPGSPAPQFQSEPANGCMARFSSTLTGEQVADHYRLAASKAGWKVEDAGEVVVEPGQEPPTPGMGSLYMNKDQMTLEVLVEPAGAEGPARTGTWVVIGVWERR